MIPCVAIRVGVPPSRASRPSAFHEILIALNVLIMRCDLKSVHVS
jgi:hypothetical protein